MISSTVGINKDQPSNKVNYVNTFFYVYSPYMFYFRKVINKDEFGVGNLIIHFLLIIFLKLLKKVIIHINQVNQ